MKKTFIMLLLSTTIATTVQADAFDIINRLPIDCSVAQQQYDFLESERSTKMDRLESSAYSKTFLGSLFAEYTGKTKWAYTTGSGTRDAVINLKQSQIREYCWPSIPTGY
jgi:hypothetical protein